MRYEKFRENTLAFKKRWYLKPLRILTWKIIVICYSLSLGMIIFPLLAWIATGEAAVVVGFCLIAIVSPHMFQIVNALRKGTRDYFEDWE